MTARSTPALTTALAEWSAGTAFTDLPAAVVHHAKRSTLDFTAAVLAGASSDPAASVQGFLAATEGPGPATVFGTASRVSPANAALANGTAAHSLEIDDGYTPGSFHPGAPILSAVLAVAEANGSGGDQVVLAAAVGYEIACRLAAAGHPATWRRGFHNTPLAGVFGATAGVAKLLGGGPEDMASALGLAGSHASGLFEFLEDGTEVKRLHAGKAARDGIVCAELALRGLTGPPTVIEGAQGYLAAYAGGEFDESAVLAGLGTDWRSLQTYIKPYPCCRHLHGPIDAVLALVAEDPIDVAQVRMVEVETFTTAARHCGHRVDSLLDAQMSIPYAVAVALVHHEAGLAQFEPAVRRDPVVAGLSARVKVRAAEDCDRDYPDMRPARVLVRTVETERSVRVDQPLGEPSNPLSDADLEAKLRQLGLAILGTEGCRRVIDDVWGMGDPRGLCQRLGAQGLT